MHDCLPACMPACQHVRLPALLICRTACRHAGLLACLHAIPNQRSAESVRSYDMYVLGHVRRLSHTLRIIIDMESISICSFHGAASLFLLLSCLSWAASAISERPRTKTKKIMSHKCTPHSPKPVLHLGSALRIITGMEPLQDLYLTPKLCYSSPSSSSDRWIASTLRLKHAFAICSFASQCDSSFPARIITLRAYLLREAVGALRVIALRVQAYSAFSTSYYSSSSSHTEIALRVITFRIHAYSVCSTRHYSLSLSYSAAAPRVSTLRA